jgi:hypothetical protein
MPGFALIELEVPLTEVGAIVIPEEYRKRVSLIGRVVETTPGYPHKCNDCGFIQTSGRRCNKCQGNLRITRSTKVRGEDILGKRILIAVGSAITPINSTIIVVANDSISAVLGEGKIHGEFVSSSGVHRCTFCGPAMPGSHLAVMLVQDGTGWYCPVCHTYENGQKHKIPASVMR